MDLLTHFANARNVRTLVPGTMVFREGAPGMAMYVVLEGEAEIMIGGRTLEKVGPGGIFGELALIDEEPRSATVVTPSGCRLVVIGREEFDILIREMPKFARQVMRVMAGRLRRMNSAMSAESLAR